MPSSPSRCHSAGVMCAAASGRMCASSAARCSVIRTSRTSHAVASDSRSSSPAPVRQAATAVVTGACASAMPSCWLSIRSTVGTTSAGTRGCSTGQSRRSSPTWWWCSRAPSRSRWSATTAARRCRRARHRARGPAPGRTGGGSSRAPPPCRGCRAGGGRGRHAGFLSSRGGAVRGARRRRRSTSRSRTSRASAGRCAPRGCEEQPHGLGGGLDVPAVGERAAVGDGPDQAAAGRPCGAARRPPTARRSRRRRPRRPRRRPAARWPAPRRAVMARTKPSMTWRRPTASARAGGERGAVGSGTSSSSPARARSTQASSRAGLLPCA